MQFYLVGEPVFKLDRKDFTFSAPAGQVPQCLEVFKQTDKEKVVNALRDEYLAVIQALIQMRLEYRIIYAHKDVVDESLIRVCIQGLGSKLVGLSSEFLPPALGYPRDFAVILPGLVLFNSRAARLVNNVGKDGSRLVVSPLGEGGRVLPAGDVVLVPERIIGDDQRSQKVSPEDLEPLKNAGLRVGVLSNPISQVYNENGPQDIAFYNDHLDRVAAFVKGKDGRLHAIIDPLFFSIHYLGGDPPWKPVDPDQTIFRIKKVCDPLGIIVHRPNKLWIPCSLNIFQSADGRVLMTSGEDELEGLVSDIVGSDSLFTTGVPIKYYPVWNFAGIRCLVSEAPPVFNKV